MHSLHPLNPPVNQTGLTTLLPSSSTGIIPSIETNRPSQTAQTNLGQKKIKKRKLEVDTKNESPVEVKKLRLESNDGKPTSAFEQLPEELYLHIISFLEKKDRLNLKLINTLFKNIINEEEFFNYREQQLHILDQFFEHLSHSEILAPYNFSDKISQIKASFNTTECFENIKFNLSDQFSVIEEKLIDLFKEISLEELLQLDKESMPIPLGFDHFFNSLILLKIFKDFQVAIPEINHFLRTTQTTTMSPKKLSSFFLFHLQLIKIMEERNFNNIRDHFQQVEEFDPEHIDKLHPRVLNLLMYLFDTDKNEVNYRDVILAILNKDNSLDLYGDNSVETTKNLYLAINCLYIQTSLKTYLLLIFYKRFNEAEKCLESLISYIKESIPYLVNYNSIINEISNAFIILINYKRTDVIGSIIEIIDKETLFPSILDSPYTIVDSIFENVVNTMHKSDKIEGLLNFIATKTKDSEILLKHFLQLNLSSNQIERALKWLLSNNIRVKSLIFYGILNKCKKLDWPGISEIEKFIKESPSEIDKAIEQLIASLKFDSFADMKNILNRLHLIEF